MEPPPTDTEPVSRIPDEVVAIVEEEGPEEATIDGEEDAELLSRATNLMSRIMSAQDNPNPRHFHALASMLETHECRYLQDSSSSSYNGGRSSHTIGRLANIINENDEFVLSLSTKYLAETRYSVSIRAAAARLLLSGSSTWMGYDDTVIENAQVWVMEDTLKSSEYKCNWKDDMGKNKPTDSEMLKTYATGILYTSLTAGGEIVEDVLTSDLSAKLMRYLRLRVLVDPNNASQKDPSVSSESKHASGTSACRGRKDNVGKSPNVFEGSRLDAPRIAHEESLADVSVDREQRNIGSKFVGDDADENNKEDVSRRRMNRGLPRNRGKGRFGEGLSENEKITSPGTVLQMDSSEQNTIKVDDAKKALGSKKVTCKIGIDIEITRADDYERYSCFVGLRDISDLVKKAVLAAEAEARVANAPSEAIRAAGDAAAELVKTSALEELESTNDTEASVLAASQAASTVVDAALASEMAHRSSLNEDSATAVESEAEADEDSVDLFIPDCECLAQLREKFCIQCLEILGEYVEALGPVLQEKGVDVCLALLQRSFKQKNDPHSMAMLPEVLRLICALAAHNKFAAVFVDRSGMQKLLSVERNTQTFLGLSSCLFTIGSLHGNMERVCALPSDVVGQVVELALKLLECSQDQARKNAAIFFGSAFVFRAIMDSFDAQEGLQKMLKILHSAASVRSGGNSGNLGTSNNGFQSDRPPSEVLTASEKQIACHTCHAMRQYFRAHLLMLVDSLRPNKSNRSLARSNARAAYKPLDISNEAMDTVFIQIQRDRKFGPTFVRAHWPAVETFFASNGHITMLELFQAPPGERNLRDLAQYALGVLHIVTLSPHKRKLIVNASLSNDRVGMAAILDAANSIGLDAEVIHPALEVLVNLVCPPPSISIKPNVIAQGQHPSSITSSIPGVENRERHLERNISDRALSMTSRAEVRDRNGDANIVERGTAATPSASVLVGSSQVCMSANTTPISSGVVGDRRISLGPGAGCAGLAAQLEQGYCQARLSVRANNGIKVLIHLLNPRMATLPPPGTLDRLRALACRVLLGLSKDDTIAHILTKLQVGKRVSELIRDSGSSPSIGTDQGRWRTELSQVAIELIAVVTNSGRASTLVATDAAAPTLRRIERAAIAAATPITYHPKELLLLIYEHLLQSDLSATAASLRKEASLTHLPSSNTSQSLSCQMSISETSSSIPWPSSRAPCGFLSDKSKSMSLEDDTQAKDDFSSGFLKKKLLISPSSNLKEKNLNPHSLSINKISSAFKSPQSGKRTDSLSVARPCNDIDHHLFKTPIHLPMKRKLIDCRVSVTPPAKHPALGLIVPSSNSQMPKFPQKSSFLSDSAVVPVVPSSTPRDNFRPSLLCNSEDNSLYINTPVSATTPGLFHEPQPINMETMTLDSLVVQYLKHQHRQCPAPITTLPPLSLLHPHVCPELSRNLDAPVNVSARLGTRELRKYYGGIHAHRRDRQFVYSRFRPLRTCRDDASLLTCLTFLGDSSRFATGIHSGELKIFDSDSGNILESNSSHQSPLMYIQSVLSGTTQMILSSASHNVKLWDASSISGGPLHSFDGCKAACFSQSGTMFAALSSEVSCRDVLLYDIQKLDIEMKFHGNLTSTVQTRGPVQSRIHFSPLDTMLLWNGILWDRRRSNQLHHFDQFTDYGGGGFHPAGNEVIINSEVWDLRNFKLLRSVPSLDQTVIKFNGGGDVIYAILRRNVEDITSAVNTRRFRKPLVAAFRTIDATSYSDIATIPVDRCVLDLATDPIDSIVGVVAMDDPDDLFSSARLYETGRRRPTDDDSDLEVDSDEEDEDEDENEDDDSETAVDALLGTDMDDGDSDADSVDEDVDSGDELDDDADFNMEDFEEQRMLEIRADGDGDISELVESMSDEDDDFEEGDFGF